MDPSIVALLPTAGTAGISGILLAIIGLLFRQSTVDRRDYRAAVAAVEAARKDDAAGYAAQLEARDKAHAAQLATLDDKLADLAGEVRAALAETEIQRHGRWVAEEEAAGLRRELASIRRETPA